MSNLLNAQRAVRNDSAENLSVIASAYADGSAKAPSDLFTMEKPKTGHYARAYGGLIVHTWGLVGQEVKDVVKLLPIIGKKFDRINFKQDKASMWKQLESLRIEVENAQVNARRTAEANGTALTAKLEDLADVVSDIESGIISPTSEQKEAYLSLLDRLTALRGSFGVKSVEVTTQEEPVLV